MNSYPKQFPLKFKAAVSVAVAVIVMLSFLVCSGSAAATDTADASASTHEELRTAILAAPVGDTPYRIEVTADIAMTGTLAISAGKNIVLYSDENDTWTLSRSSSSNPRHFTVAGTFTLENIILDGGSAYGGVSVNTASSVFYLNAGAVIQNCKTSTASEGGGLTVTGGGTATVSGGKILNNQKPNTNGGGGIYMNGGTLTIEGGEICGNKAGDETSSTTAGINGGGISAFNSTIMITGGKINGNKAARHGGGVSLGANTVFTMTGGEIIGNVISANTDTFGAGIYGAENTEINIFGVTIHGNASKKSGGGIYALGALNISDSTISGNTVTNGNGGGIFAAGATTMDNCTVTGNTAGGGSISGNGGGLYYNNASAELAISNGVFSSNKAQTTTTGIAGSGGAIWGGGTIKLSGNVRIGGDTAAEGNTAEQYGGGIYLGGGSTLTISDTVKISHNTANNGGGILCNGGSPNPASISIGDSVEVSNNHAARYGGGIMSTISTGVGTAAHVITIAANANVSGNTAGMLGGGVYLYRGSSVNVDGGAICGNTAGTNGGGIYGSTATSIVVSDGEITNNSATNGGGIYGVTASAITVSGSKITGNTATAAGGGIFTEETEYKNLPTEYTTLDIAADTIFSGNSAAVTYLPPDDAAALYPKILFAEVSATTHPLNNDDINYQGAVASKYAVTYHANGGSGSFLGSEIVQGGKDIVLSPSAAGIAYDGHDFIGWNTNADATGIAYAPDDTIVLLGNVDLYAQWKSNAVPPGPYVPTSDPDPDPTPDPIPDPDPVPDPDPEPLPDPDPEPEPEPDPKPHIPGGTDPDVLPVTNEPGATLVPTAEGRYIELGEGAIPLGEWYWDAVPEMWLFDEYPPLGALPQTGYEGIGMTRLLLLLGVSLLGMGLRLESGEISYKPKRLKK